MKYKLGLFVTCPVDLLRPSIGFACVKLLEDAGCHVEVPSQSCCGQVAYNNGDPESCKTLAWNIVQQFDEFDYVVIPSGSCGGMIKLHYVELFQRDERLARVKAFCEKVYEITTFLSEILKVSPTASTSPFSDKKITYHDSCAGLREMKIKQQPRELLKKYTDIDLSEMKNTEECCGFGGTFCVKFSDVSNNMVTEKLNNAREVDADLLVGGDLSCLLNIAGKMHRQKSEETQLKPLQVRHVVEVLAGDIHTPAIGESSEPLNEQ